MSQAIELPQFLHVTPEQGRYRRWLVRGLLALVLAALSIAIVTSAIEVVEAALADQRAAADAVAVAVVEYPKRELPREWQWTRKPVAVDHMYRRIEPDRLDWIHSGGRR